MNKRLVTLVTGLVLSILVFQPGCAPNLNQRLSDLENQSDEDRADITALKNYQKAIDTRLDKYYERLDELSSTGGDDALAQYELLDSTEIYFEINRHELDDAARVELEKTAKRLASRPDAILEVIGCADSDGPSQYNLQLGYYRAEKVKNYLEAVWAIPMTRMFTLSVGESRIQGVEDTPENKLRERRVILRLKGDPTYGDN